MSERIPRPADGPGRRQGRFPLPPDAPDIRVSVLVAVWKAARYLPACLDNLIRQTIFADSQVLVIDTGSPENEAKIVADYALRHPNIRLLRTPVRETIYAAWNRGVRASRSPYLINVNADDSLRPDGLAILADTLDRHPGVTAVYADSLVTDQPCQPYEQARITGRFRWPEFDPDLMFKASYLGPHPMWRRTLHGRYGLFDPTLRIAGDYEFWLRLCRHERFLHVAEPLGLYYQAADGAENSNPALCYRESELARRLHWPLGRGPRPRPEGDFFVARAD